MPVRAESDSRYYRRFIIMGIAALGFAVFCLYDGTIRYPHRQVRALAFKKLLDEGRAPMIGMPTRVSAVGGHRSPAIPKQRTNTRAAS